MKNVLRRVGKAFVLWPGGDAQHFARPQMLQSVCDDCSLAKGRSLAKRRVHVSNFQQVAFSQGATLVAAEPAQQVCRRAAKERLLFNFAAAAQIPPPSRTPRARPKPLPRP